MQKGGKMPTYMALIREVADKLEEDFKGNLDFAIAELYNLSLRLKQEKERLDDNTLSGCTW